MSSIDRYDSGLLGGHKDCSVEWWHDYLRVELDRAHDFYQQQFTSLWESLDEVRSDCRDGETSSAYKTLTRILGPEDA